MFTTIITASAISLSAGHRIPAESATAFVLPGGTKRQIPAESATLAALRMTREPRIPAETATASAPTTGAKWPFSAKTAAVAAPLMLRAPRISAKTATASPYLVPVVPSGIGRGIHVAKRSFAARFVSAVTSRRRCPSVSNPQVIRAQPHAPGLASRANSKIWRKRPRRCNSVTSRTRTRAAKFGEKAAKTATSTLPSAVFRRSVP